MPDDAQTAEQEPTRFSTGLPIIVLTRPEGTDIDWQEVDRGPGYFTIPADQEIRVKIKSANDDQFVDLINDLRDVRRLRFLDLAENRNITNDGLAKIKALPQLTGLNLSSVGVTTTGLEVLRSLPHLAYLNLSFCNKLTDQALKVLDARRSILFVDLQGCPGITNGGLARIRRRSLTIHH